MVDNRVELAFSAGTLTLTGLAPRAVDRLFPTVSWVEDARTGQWRTDAMKYYMVTEGLNSALVFKNPQAQSYCGCGESFALGDESGQDDGLGSQDIGDLAKNVGSEAD